MIDRQQQSVELLKLLGEETAEAVLAHLPSEFADLLRAELAADQPVHKVKLQDKRAILEDFEWFFDYALKTKPPEPSVFEEPEEDEADDDGEEEEKEIVLTGNAMHDLTLLSIHQLSGALESEQPRTIAILLNSMSPQLAANVLSLFPDELRQSIARQLLKEQNAPQLLVERIARATVQRAITLPQGPKDRRDHVDRLAEVIREVPKSYRKEMMAAIEEEDADLSAALLKKLYRFEDMKTLDPHLVQKVLGEIDGTTLTTAMFGADQSVIDAVLGNLSRRARQTIEEELQFMSRVPESKVRMARDTVAELIGKLDQEGE